MKALTVSTFVCTMVFLASIDAKTLRRGKSCPNHWIRSRGRCYFYVSTDLPWAQAEKNCLSMGANLASVHSKKEYRTIQWLILKRTGVNGQTWLGASDCQKEGVWLWSDGTPFNYRYFGGFDNWKHRQHCLQMNYGGKYLWDDVECWSRLPSVCAKNAV